MLRNQFLTCPTEDAERSTLACGNEVGVEFGVELPLQKRERGRAGAAGGAGKPRAVQGQTAVEIGSGKLGQFRGASDRDRPVWIRHAHLRTGQRQPSMRRIKQAGPTQAPDPMPGIGQGKTHVAGGVHTRNCRIIGAQFVAFWKSTIKTPGTQSLWYDLQKGRGSVEMQYLP